MTRAPVPCLVPVAPDYDRTLVLELSNTSWVPAAQVPGLPRVKAKRTIEPTAEALLAAVQGYRERAQAAGCQAERVALVSRVGAVLATLGVGECNPLLRNRRERLDALRTALGTSLPPHAHAKISRMLDRLDLVRADCRAGTGARRGAGERGAGPGGRDDPAARFPARHRRAKRHHSGARGVRARVRQRQGARVLRGPLCHAV